MKFYQCCSDFCNAIGIVLLLLGFSMAPGHVASAYDGCALSLCPARDGGGCTDKGCKAPVPYCHDKLGKSNCSCWQTPEK